MTSKAWRRPIPSALTAAVEAAIGSWDALPPTGDRVEALEALSSAGQPAVLRHVAHLCVVGPGGVRAAAGAAVRALTRLCEEDDLVEFDAELRNISPWGHRGNSNEQQAWWKLTPRDLRRVLMASGWPSTAAGVASMHRSGHVRQAAVEAMGAMPEPELAYLLVRTTDWVPEVREAAERALANHLGPERAQELARLLSLVHRLSLRDRAATSPGLRAVARILRSAEGHGALWQVLEAGTRAGRREAAEILVAVDLERVLEHALASTDGVLAARVAQATISRFDTLEPQRYLPVLRTSKHARVRRLALTWGADHGMEALDETLSETLLDRCRSVREVAQFYSRRRGRDPAAAYRELLDEGDPARAKIAAAGLGECGKAADVKNLLPLLQDARPGLARTILCAVGRLDPRGQSELLLRLLADPRRGVSRECRDALAKHRLVPLAGKLWTLLSEAAPEHVRVHAVSLLRYCSKWDAAPLLLRATATLDGTEGRIAALSLAKWRLAHRVRNYAILPSPPEREAYEAALRRYGEEADRRLKEL